MELRLTLNLGKTQQSKQTRERIAQAALKLFNAQSVSTVNTHHIAEAAEISPGNLYYHFKNKEEIVREIFLSMEIFSRDHWTDRGPRNPKVNIVDFMRFFVGNVRTYRFFFREFAQLIQVDPQLAKLWRMSYEELMHVMRGAVHLWTESGILKKFATAEDVDSFIHNCWINLMFSTLFLDAAGGKKTGAVNEELFLRFLYPYHTQKGQKALELYM